MKKFSDKTKSGVRRRRIGLIADTHNLLRPEALQFLRGSDLIVHAGDVCKPEILAALSDLAQARAVRGNNDQGEWAEAVPETLRLEIDDVGIFVIHDRSQLTIDPAALGLRVVIHGHSHKPHVEERDGVLYVNPGSAGPRRFRLPISAAEMCIVDGEVSIRLVDLTA